MADLKQEIVKVLARAKADIQARMQAAGVNATGRTSASLQVRETATGVFLVGGGENTAPFPTVEIGRPGGKVPKGFYYIIKQWTRDKGLPFATERKRGTFAYFLSRRIAAEGTLRHKQPVDIYTSVAEQAARNLKGTLYAYIQTNINQQVKDYGRQ